MTTDRVVTVVSYSMTDAAKKLGVSRMTLWRAVRDGKLAARKSGNTVIISSADLLDYVLSYRGGEGVPGGVTFGVRRPGKASKTPESPR